MNLHIKFNQQLIKMLNVEFGRLKGWIKTPKEASEELNISEQEARQCFQTNFLLTAGSGLKILGIINKGQ